MKFLLIVFFTSLVILLLVFLLNLSTYNGKQTDRKNSPLDKIENEKKS